MSPGLLLRVVRTVGSDRTHVVEVPPDLLVGAVVHGADFSGVTLPVVTRCGAELRRGAVGVCMRPGTRVRCSHCRRISGVEVAPEGNMLIPAQGAP